jgi:hypothetical protein
MQTKATIEASKAWRKAEDTVLDAFFACDGCFTITGNEEDRIPTATAFLDYQRYTQNTGRKPLGRNHFYDRIKTSPDLKAAGVKIIMDRKGQNFIVGARDGRAQLREKVDHLSLVVLEAS